MSRVIKFRAYVKFLGEMQAVTEIKLNGNVFVDDYFYALAQDDINLMQYTGLKDKDGVDIYEGDILCAGNEKYKGVVFYKSSSTQFLVDVFLSGKRVCRNEVSEFIAKRGRAIKSECVVIGNIHQNPELLK